MCVIVFVEMSRFSDEGSSTFDAVKSAIICTAILFKLTAQCNLILCGGQTGEVIYGCSKRCCISLAALTLTPSSQPQVK